MPPMVKMLNGSLIKYKHLCRKHNINIYKNISIKVYECVKVVTLGVKCRLENLQKIICFGGRSLVASLTAHPASLSISSDLLDTIDQVDLAGRPLLAKKYRRGVSQFLIQLFPLLFTPAIDIFFNFAPSPKGCTF